VPSAALDISTSLIQGLNIHSSASKNENIVAQNNQGSGVVIGTDLSSSYVRFFLDHPISSGQQDAFVRYTTDGNLSIDVSSNLHVSSATTISQGEDVIHHPYGETLAVYDVSSGVFFQNIYQNPAAFTGASASFVADTNNSNTTINVCTLSGVGATIIGGAYPLDTTRSMKMIGLP
jgi:hypothetical protein